MSCVPVDQIWNWGAKTNKVGLRGDGDVRNSGDHGLVVLVNSLEECLWYLGDKVEAVTVADAPPPPPECLRAS